MRYAFSACYAAAAYAHDRYDITLLRGYAMMPLLRLRH